MQVQKTTGSPFKGYNNFYILSAELEKNIPLSRGVIDIFGSDIPWLIMANNDDERWEKARRMGIVFFLLFLSPIFALPIANRVGMKYCSKLVKNLSSNDHKVIHISNNDLKDVNSLKIGLEKLSDKYENGPIENAYLWLKKKMTGKKTERRSLDYLSMIKDLQKKYNLSEDKAWEKLRTKLINTKNGIMCSDYLFSSLSLGSVGFINNEITKKETGKSGFSAEFNMADKEIVEKRAQKYEETKKYRYGTLVAASLALGSGIPLAVRHGLLSKAGGGFAKFMNKHADKFDYTKGIYMSRWSLLLGNIICCHAGALLANRNETELKDNALRFSMADALFFGGDLVVGSIFGRLSDRFLTTDLIDKKPENLKKLLPKLRYLSDIKNTRDRKYGIALYWLNLATIAAAMGFLVPAAANSITKKDVKKDVEKYLGANNFSNQKFLNKFLIKNLQEYTS